MALQGHTLGTGALHVPQRTVLQWSVGSFKAGDTPRSRSSR